MSILINLSLKNSNVFNFSYVRLQNNSVNITNVNRVVFTNSYLIDSNLVNDNSDHFYLYNTTIESSDVELLYVNDIKIIDATIGGFNNIRNIDELTITDSILLGNMEIDFSQDVNINNFSINGTLDFYKVNNTNLTNSIVQNDGRIEFRDGVNNLFKNLRLTSGYIRLIQDNGYNLELNITNATIQNGNIRMISYSSYVDTLYFENVSTYNTSFDITKINLIWRYGENNNGSFSAEDNSEITIVNVSIVNRTKIEIEEYADLYLSGNLINNSNIEVYKAELNMNNSLIENSTITAYSYSGTAELYSYNNRYKSSVVNVTKTDFEIEKDEFDNNSKVLIMNNARGSVVSSVFMTQIRINSNQSLIFYNNIFNTSSDPLLILSQPNLDLNTSKTVGTSIIGTPLIGGNYWAKPDGTGYSETCPDIIKDNLCDLPYKYQNYSDYYPLTNNTQFNYCDVSTENELVNAINNNNCLVIRLMNNIQLSSTLSIGRSLIIYGNGWKLLKGDNISITPANKIRVILIDLSLQGNVNVENIELVVVNTTFNSNLSVFETDLIAYLFNVSGNLSSRSSTLSFEQSNISGSLVGNGSTILFNNVNLTDALVYIFNRSSLTSNNSIFNTSNLSVGNSNTDFLNTKFISSMLLYNDTSSNLLEDDNKLIKNVHFIDSKIIIDKISKHLTNNIFENTSIKAINSLVLIYNNIFNATQYNIESESSTVILNINKVMGLSVINTSRLGGNYWAKPDGTGYSETCTDADLDNICDTNYSINQFVDQYPLKKSTSPNVCLVSNVTELVNAFSNNSCEVIRLNNTILLDNHVTISNFNNKILDGRGLSIKSSSGYLRELTFSQFNNFGITNIIIGHLDWLTTELILIDGGNLSMFDIKADSLEIRNVSDAYAYYNFISNNVYARNFQNFTIINSQLSLGLENNKYLKLYQNKISYLGLFNSSESEIILNKIVATNFNKVRNIRIMYNTLGAGWFSYMYLINSNMSIDRNVLLLRDIYLYDSSNITITNSTLVNQDMIKFGLYGNSTLIVNNSIILANRTHMRVDGKAWLFNNIINISNSSAFTYELISSSELLLNTSKQNAQNIINKSYIGGNYWTTPNNNGYSDTCADNDQDYICDNPYYINSSIIDYYPLTLGGILDNQPPNITLISPTHMSSHPAGNVNLRFRVTDNLATSLTCNYIINGTSLYNNTTIIQNGSIYSQTYNLLAGSYRLDINCSGGVNNQYVNITFNVINTSGGGGGGSSGSYEEETNITQNVSQNITQNISQNTSQNTSITQNVSQNITQNVSQNNITQNVSQNITQPGPSEVVNVTTNVTNITDSINITLPSQETIQNQTTQNQSITSEEDHENITQNQTQDQKDVYKADSQAKGTNLETYWWLIIPVIAIVVALLFILKKRP